MEIMPKDEGPERKGSQCVVEMSFGSMNLYKRKIAEQLGV